MIPQLNITAWSAQAPWPEPRQVEQDLVIARALVAIFTDPVLTEELRLRGGTALNKLHFPAPLRYSEDIDLVRTTHGPIRPILDRLRAVLEPWLGAGAFDQSAVAPKLRFRAPAEGVDGLEIRLKVRGLSPAHRLAARRATSRPIVESLRAWLEAQLPHLPGRGKLAEAMRYALARWAGLTRFLTDGRIELDTNPVERAIRPVALGRKNHLFAGSDRGGDRWAVICSLVETCKLNGVEPYAYLRDVLTRMVDGHRVNRLDELLPWAWEAENHVKT